MTDKVMSVIKNTVPEARIINEIIGGVSSAPTKSAPSNSSNDIYAETTQTKVSSSAKKEEPVRSEAPSRPSTSSSSLEDLYNDL